MSIDLTAAGIGYLAAVALAATFVLAAVAKLANRRETVEGFRRLGLPRPAVLVTVTSVVELAAALLLVLLPPVGAAVSLVALVFFTVFLGSRIREGSEAPCNCFGAQTSRPIAKRDVARNGGLAVVAFLALLAPTPTAPTAADVVVVVTALVLALVARHALVPPEDAAAGTAR